MLNIIIALFGLTRDAMLPLRRIYFRIIVRTFIAIIILTIIGWLINIAGLPGLNILFFLILLTTAVIVAFMPDSLAVTLAAGIVSGIAEEPETIEDEVKSFSKAYMKAACEITFWISIAFFFLGTMSFQERPSAFFLIVSALAVIGLVSYKLDIVGRLGWKVVLYYAVIVLMVNILGLIPGYIWVKVTGHNPVSTFSISNTEKNISTIGDLSSKIEDERNSARLNEIIDKMKNSKITEAELSDEDKEFLKKMRENKAQENLPCRISGIVESTLGK
ncbi:MAG: hypothetical protein NTZ97_00740 [Candidatus Moranbacteria bacterium]|nr:hypothetical protein [Candidatus Moranbacteria bacterium]